MRVRNRFFPCGLVLAVVNIEMWREKEKDSEKGARKGERQKLRQ